MAYLAPALFAFTQGRQANNQTFLGQENVYSAALDNYNKRIELARNELNFRDELDLRGRVSLGVQSGLSSAGALQQAYGTSDRLFTQNQGLANLVAQQRLGAGFGVLQSQQGDNSLLQALGIAPNGSTRRFSTTDIASIYGPQGAIDIETNNRRVDLAQSVNPNTDVTSDIAAARAEAAEANRRAAQAEADLRTQQTQGGTVPNAEVGIRDVDRDGNRRASRDAAEQAVTGTLPTSISLAANSNPDQAAFFQQTSNTNNGNRRYNDAYFGDTRRNSSAASQTLHALLGGADAYGPAYRFG